MIEAQVQNATGWAAARDRRDAASTAVWVNRFGAVIVAAYCLAGSRWGSYALPGPPYILDLMIGVLLVNRVLLIAARRERTMGKKDAIAATFAGLLLAWTLLRLVAGELTPDALRDVAPYLYCVIIFLVIPTSEEDDRIATRILTGALVFHLVWVTVTIAVGKLPFMPFIPWASEAVAENRTGLFVLGLRPDFDTLVVGTLAALSLHRLLSGRRNVLNLVLFAWCVGVTLAGFQTTSGLLAILVQFLVVALLAATRRQKREKEDASPRQKRDRKNAGMASIALLLVVVPIGLFQVRNTELFTDLPIAVGLAQPKPFVKEGASGTTGARKLTWTTVINKVGSKPHQVIAGVGFGPNYLSDTGAVRYLTFASGNRLVRSPHNYWIGTWARTGVIGLTIALLLLLAAYRVAWLTIRSRRANDIDVIAILLIASLPVSASVGVIFESPFGVIPYFWAIGRLAVTTVRLGLARPLSADTAADRNLSQRTEVTRLTSDPVRTRSR